MTMTKQVLSTELDLLGILVNSTLGLWDVPENARATLINVSENATYLVEARDYKAVLRVHRPGYHSRRAIECELAWSEALGAQAGVQTPAPYRGKNGEAVQVRTLERLGEPRFMVLFEFIDGTQPDEKKELTGSFEELGAIAAQTHIHSMNWAKPQPFERLVWDTDAIFGPQAKWGNWRDAPNVTAPIRAILERVEETIKARLYRFGRGSNRYGLIHADMRLANLIINQNGTRLIDFDDCGMGWFLYDFAASISFIEDHPQVPALKAAWLRGYRQVRPISLEEEDEIDTFVMLRRLALLAWIGSHIDAPEPQAMAPHFATVSAELGDAYLGRFRGEGA